MNIKNHVQLIGHVGNTPEVKELASNKRMAKFSIATNESYKDTSGSWVNKTEWHNIVVWGKQTDLVQKHIHKGTELAMTGKLTTRQWEDAAGQKRYTTEIILNEFALVGQRKAHAS